MSVGICIGEKFARTDLACVQVGQQKAASLESDFCVSGAA